MSSERRSDDRIDILGELGGEVMVFQAMTLKQLSPTGARIETPFPLQLDSLHQIRLTLGSRSVVVKGRVAHCQVSDMEHEHIAYQSGIQFIEVSDRIQEAIEQFVEAVRVARQGS